MRFCLLLLAKRPRIGYSIMVNTCVRGVFSLTQTLATVLQCAVLAMMPVVELRAALPWAIASCGFMLFLRHFSCELFAAEDMEMEVGDCLAGVGTAV